MKVLIESISGVSAKRWKAMKPAERRAYLKKHPNSRYAKNGGNQSQRKLQAKLDELQHDFNDCEEEFIDADEAEEEAQEELEEAEENGASEDELNELRSALDEARHNTKQAEERCIDLIEDMRKLQATMKRKL